MPTYRDKLAGAWRVIDSASELIVDYRRIDSIKCRLIARLRWDKVRAMIRYSSSIWRLSTRITDLEQGISSADSIIARMYESSTSAIQENELLHSKVLEAHQKMDQLSQQDAKVREKALTTHAQLEVISSYLDGASGFDYRYPQLAPLRDVESQSTLQIIQQNDTMVHQLEEIIDTLQTRVDEHEDLIDQVHLSSIRFQDLILTTRAGARALHNRRSYRAASYRAPSTCTTPSTLPEDGLVRSNSATDILLNLDRIREKLAESDWSESDELDDKVPDVRSDQ